MKQGYLTAALALLLLFGLVGCHSGSTAAREARQGAETAGRTLSNQVRNQGTRVHPTSFREKNYSLASTTKSALEANGMHDATAAQRERPNRIVRMGMRSAAVGKAAARTGWWQQHNLGQQVNDGLEQARDIGAEVKNDVKRDASDIAQGAENLAKDIRQGAGQAAADIRDAAARGMDETA